MFKFYIYLLAICLLSINCGIISLPKELVILKAIETGDIDTLRKELKKGDYDIKELILLNLENVEGYENEKVEMLIDEINYEDPGIRMFALNNLGFLGSAAKPAVQHIIQRLRVEDDLGVKILIPIILIKIGSDTEIKDGLILCLDEDDYRVKLAAIRAISKLGESGKDLLPNLKEYIDYPKKEIRDAIMDAIEVIENDQAP